jgi:oxygen-independent coproporphyrinogen-3 oxidase
VPGAFPDGQPAPADGRLPQPALDGLGQRPFGLYLHVPFCTTRCGYCDFTTYTAAELGPAAGASRATWADGAVAELQLARRVLGGADLPVSTVFFGGGTPTVLPPADLVRVLTAVGELFGLAAGAEVTTEANPDSVTPMTLAELRAGGFTRVSFGMQSAVPHVLRVLDRTHTAGGAVRAVRWAHEAGFRHVNVDLIYGTPGESAGDWLRSLDAVVGAGPDHVSAYALVVEAGTRLAARVRRGELPPPDDDVLADRYEAADEVLAAAGFAWYEVSNWASGPAARCAHNLLYWTGGDWWGVGPGAHSHVGGTRWWNMRHPGPWAAAVGAGRSPGQGREVLGTAERHTESVLLGLRLRDGLDLDVLDDGGRRAARAAVAGGLLVAAAADAGRAVLTRRGRLLADTVVRSLLGG